MQGELCATVNNLKIIALLVIICSIYGKNIIAEKYIHSVLRSEKKRGR